MHFKMKHWECVSRHCW